MRNDFVSEEIEVLDTFLDNYVFCNNLKMDNKNVHFNTHFGPPAPGVSGIGIEIIVRPECNQKCQYCYITQHGKELYPIEERVDNATILRNIDALLTYVYDVKKVYISHWELFAGDMFYDNLYFDILDIFYKHISKIWETRRSILKEAPILLLSPINFSQINDDKKMARLEEYIEKMKTINIHVGLSCSVDGKYVSLTREGKEFPDEHWDKLFSWLVAHNYQVHPMVAPDNIENWIQNYDWWIEMFEKYFSKVLIYDFQPMMLEVRNDEWTPEKIKAYTDLLSHMFDKRLELCHGDIDELAYHLFNGDGNNNTLHELMVYDPLMIRPMEESASESQKMSCSLQGLLHITANNLSLVPCHRTTYKQFVAGKFEQDETGAIVGLSAHNVNAFLSIMLMDTMTMPKCSGCRYKQVCIKQCLGSMFEANGEIFQPACTVCDFFEAKYDFLISSYFERGLIESAKKQGLLEPYQYGVYERIYAKVNEKRQKA